MKRMKKLFALLMTLAMVMGLGITGFAEESVNITITNATNATLKYVKVIEPDSTKETGWDFVGDYAKYFTADDAFGNMDTQAIIKGMIADIDEDANSNWKITGFTAKYNAALQNVIKSFGETTATIPPAAEGQADRNLPVSDAGLYVIGGTETNYTYNPMAAFVGIEYSSGKPSGVLEPDSINAKKQPLKPEKSADDNDKITEIGRPVTYTITSTVPYFPETNENPSYWVSDVILKGAEYVETSEGSGKVNVTVKVGDSYNQTHVVNIEKYTGGDNDPYNGKDSFALDLTTELDVANNKYANQQITVTYVATVTDVLLQNDAMFGEGEHQGDFGTDTEKLVTAKVTFVKTDSENTNIKLNGAQFVLTNGESGNALRYGYFTSNAGENGTTAYKFAGWLTEAEAKDENDNFISSVILETGGTGEDEEALGTFTVAGLDTEIDYKFEEIKAPDGYSLNKTNSPIQWTVTDSNEDGIPDDLDNELTGTSSMTDTTLSELPSTGGMGTTLFTIAGCVIMISAAGLFFATRKKAN